MWDPASLSTWNSIIQLSDSNCKHLGVNWGPLVFWPFLVQPSLPCPVGIPSFSPYLTFPNCLLHRSFSVLSLLNQLNDDGLDNQLDTVEDQRDKEQSTQKAPRWGCLLNQGPSEKGWIFVSQPLCPILIKPFQEWTFKRRDKALTDRSDRSREDWTTWCWWQVRKPNHPKFVHIARWSVSALLFQSIGFGARNHKRLIEPSGPERGPRPRAPAVQGAATQSTPVQVSIALVISVSPCHCAAKPSALNKSVQYFSINNSGDKPAESKVRADVDKLTDKFNEPELAKSKDGEKDNLIE